MAYKKTAKDLAWDRERTKYNSTISSLKEEIRKLCIELEAKEAIIEHDQELIQFAQEEIERLKSLIPMPAEELEVYLKDAREKADREKKLLGLASTFLNFPAY